ncbi:hypothetical protein F9B85_01190 [Heliorestis acidaminivorans]|uniref:YlzJ-like protein n=1 Tax=Heliorestis acidaminivorans TaxID=553427 RepID=A0A6I0EVC7_9FIRM|nr:YlzJ-like family protein [Heliorestis acidaminivorans]KAB2954334.1 hypothetical protein F9B85_01190 [Heliorestis acidaminivorans]
MIIYTPLPAEMVLKGLEPSVPEMSNITYKGKSVMGYKKEDGHYELTRILSTDPQDFLDPQLQPGRTVLPD